MPRSGACESSRLDMTRPERELLTCCAYALLNIGYHVKQELLARPSPPTGGSGGAAGSPMAVTEIENYLVRLSRLAAVFEGQIRKEEQRATARRQEGRVDARAEAQPPAVR